MLLKKLELHEAVPRATLTPLSCSPNFPRAQYLDIRTLTHELIANLKFLRLVIVLIPPKLASKKEHNTDTMRVLSRNFRGSI